MTTYADVFKKNQYNAHEAAQKSRTWFQQQARLLGTQHIAPQKLVRSDASRNVPKILPGELYLFQYDAKHQDKLDYWDMFPLVFPFSKLPDGFIGLNMHYLPYQFRIMLLDRLMVFKNRKDLTEDAKLKFQWGTISGVSQFKWAAPCVHRYLGQQVQSPFKRIDPQDWATAMMLPVERFVGASKQKVWTESLR